jgi:hypothetical protein
MFISARRRRVETFGHEYRNRVELASDSENSSYVEVS